MQAGGRRFEPGTLHLTNTGIAASRDGGRGRFRGRLATDWLQQRRSGSYASLMSAITVERDLRLPVRVEFRELERDLLEGRLSPAEYDALVDELLVALGVPLAEAED